MPLVPKRQRRKSQASALADLTDDLRRELEKGRAFFEGFPDRESMETCWNQVRDELLPIWIAEHPGYRPFAWWLFDHQKERPILAPWATDEFIARHRAQSNYGFIFGDVWCGCHLMQNETAYLHENGLLEPGEFDRFIVQLRSVMRDTRARATEWILRHDPKNLKLLYEVTLVGMTEAELFRLANQEPPGPSD